MLLVELLIKNKYLEKARIYVLCSRVIGDGDNIQVKKKKIEKPSVQLLDDDFGKVPKDI